MECAVMQVDVCMHMYVWMYVSRHACVHAWIDGLMHGRVHMWAVRYSDCYL